MHSVAWKYIVEKENQIEFEKEYGNDGAWSILFAKSKNYLGSFLNKDIEVNGNYLLIDTWTEKRFYDTFKEENKEIYNELSSKFERLYSEEEKIGEFNSINEKGKNK